MGPEVLSQSEIDALLKALSSGTVDIAALTSEEKERAIKVYDLSAPISSIKISCGLFR